MIHHVLKMLYDYLQILKPQVGYNAIGTLYAGNILLLTAYQSCYFAK